MNATEFLKTWVKMGVDALRHHGSTPQIFDEVRQCQNAAFKTGVSEDDLDIAANGDIASYLQKSRNSSSNTGPETNIKIR